MATVRSCKGCGSTTRALTQPGPRCATCWRAEKKRRSQANHGKRMASTFGITAEEYAALYEAQGGRCAICRKARGLKRRLALDHDHACCPEPPTCGECARGLLCVFCNNEVLGRLDLEALIRAARYLIEPPAKEVLAKLRGTG